VWHPLSNLLITELMYADVIRNLFLAVTMSFYCFLHFSFRFFLSPFISLSNNTSSTGLLGHKHIPKV